MCIRDRQHSPPDSQSAIPDLERVPRVPARGEVELGVGGDVVEPATDDAERHHPQRHRLHDAGGAAAGFPSTLAHPDGDCDPGQDAQRVGADGEGPQVPYALGWARDAQRDDQGVGCPFMRAGYWRTVTTATAAPTKVL